MSMKSLKDIYNLLIFHTKNTNADSSNGVSLINFKKKGSNLMKLFYNIILYIALISLGMSIASILVFGFNNHNIVGTLLTITLIIATNIALVIDKKEK